MTDLLYVDEDGSQGRRVMRAADRSDFFERSQVKHIEPLPTLEEMIEAIVAENCKVLVTDFDLSDEQIGVQYNGNDLVSEIRRRFEGFPCFVTTNYPEDAVGQNVDVSLIFPKNDYLDPDEAHSTSLTFFERVRQSIDDYGSKFERKSKRFEELHRLYSQRDLNLAEVDELLELDDFFENALNKTEAMPRVVKEKALAPFNELILRAGSLVEKIEKELN